MWIFDSFVSYLLWQWRVGFELFLGQKKPVKDVILNPDKMWMMHNFLIFFMINRLSVHGSSYNHNEIIVFCRAATNCLHSWLHSQNGLKSKYWVGVLQSIDLDPCINLTINNPMWSMQTSIPIIIFKMINIPWHICITLSIEAQLHPKHSKSQEQPRPRWWRNAQSKCHNCFHDIVSYTLQAPELYQTKFV